MKQTTQSPRDIISVLLNFTLTSSLSLIRKQWITLITKAAQGKMAVWVLKIQQTSKSEAEDGKMDISRK